MMDKQDNMNDPPANEEVEFAEGNPVDESPTLEAEIESLRAEKQAAFEKLARVQADFSNSRKRLEAEFEQRFAFANQELVKAMLPVIDNFERAMAQDPAKADAASLLSGLKMVHEQLSAVLAKAGVEVISPQAGDDFDPNVHEALLHEPSEVAAGKVAKLLQKGYAMKGRVLRSAQVAVSSGPAK